jgi:hypothetical protein
MGGLGFLASLSVGEGLAPWLNISAKLCSLRTAGGYATC